MKRTLAVAICAVTGLGSCGSTAPERALSCELGVQVFDLLVEAAANVWNRGGDASEVISFAAEFAAPACAAAVMEFFEDPNDAVAISVFADQGSQELSISLREILDTPAPHPAPAAELDDVVIARIFDCVLRFDTALAQQLCIDLDWL